MKQFLAILLFCGILGAAELKQYRAEPYLLGSLHLLSEAMSSKWEAGGTAGAGVRFPVEKVPVNTTFSIEFGELSGKGTYPDLVALISTLALEYELSRTKRRVIFGAGLGNLLISSEENFDPSKPFAGETENEFGVALYAEPALTVNRWSFGVRLQERCIFSSPEKVYLHSLSLVVGGRF